jgi:hypothetical protein
MKPMQGIQLGLRDINSSLFFLLLNGEPSCVRLSDWQGINPHGFDVSCLGTASFLYSCEPICPKLFQRDTKLGNVRQKSTPACERRQAVVASTQERDDENN